MGRQTIRGFPVPGQRGIAFPHDHRPRRPGDQAIRPFLDGFFGEEIIDDVVEYQAAIAVDGLVHPPARQEVIT